MVALFRVGFFPSPPGRPLGSPGVGVFPALLRQGLEPGYIRLPFAFAPMDRITLDFIWLKLRVLWKTVRDARVDYSTG